MNASLRVLIGLTLAAESEPRFKAIPKLQQIAPDKVVKNSHGQYVSREEVERGVSLENPTVLRDACSNDYMRGVYEPIEF